MVLKISKLLVPAQIRLDLTSTKRTSAIHEVALLLEHSPSMLNLPSFYEELLLRERTESTCLGNEVAFPHARSDHVKEMVIAAGVSKSGVLFENSNQVVKLIFVIGTPKRMVTEYLAVVGALARILKENTVREKLLNATSSEAFHTILSEHES